MCYVLTLVFASGYTTERYSDTDRVRYLFSWYPSLVSVTTERVHFVVAESRP